ncbi:exported hypothetical protein [Gammaproteobacteria bacterium]
MQDCILKAGVFLAVGLFLSSSIAFAEEDKGSNPNKKLGIYLCTKDIDSKQSWPSTSTSVSSGNDNGGGQNVCKAPSEIYNNVKNDGTFIPYHGLDGKCHAKIRHCFMVQAWDIGKGSNENHGERVLNLEYKYSYGFGKRNGETAAYRESIFLGEDPSYKTQAVSCELIFSENDLTEEYLSRYDWNINKAMNHKWADVESAMDGEIAVGYDLLSHNCCTVAIKAAQEIKANTDAVDHLFDINYGVGTKFTGILGASSALVVSLLRSSSEEQQEQKKEEAAKLIQDQQHSEL